MRKYTILLQIVLLMLLVLPMQVWADTILSADDFGSVTEALRLVPEDAGKVTLKLSGSNLKETDNRLSLPSDKNISEFVLLPEDGLGSVSLPDVERICANGVPLVIGEGIIMENASIYGGACVSDGELSVNSSNIIVNGSVGFVFGGGFAETGAGSFVDETSVTLTKAGLVYFEIFGGGHAHGSGSRVSVKDTTLKISGTSDYVLGGGFAEDGGYSMCENTYVETAEGSSVPVALFTGGSASGGGSLSVVESAKGAVAGKANWAFSGDFAFSGGKTELKLASRLEILSTGESEIAYMGSFASDEGSEAIVNTAELMDCGNVSRIIQEGQATDNGKAITNVKALFPCVP